MIDSSRYCVLLDATVRKIPVAQITVRSPFNIGECEVLCAQNLVLEFISGNIYRIRDLQNQIINWENFESRIKREIVVAEQTRTKKAR